MSVLLTTMQLLPLFSSVRLVIILVLPVLLGPAAIPVIPIMEDCSFLEAHTVAVQLDIMILEMSTA